MSRIYYEFDPELESHKGRAAGNGWRSLESRKSIDGAYEYHVMWRPKTGERLIYAKPAYVPEASPLVPPAAEHVRVRRTKRSKG